MYKTEYKCIEAAGETTASIIESRDAGRARESCTLDQTTCNDCAADDEQNIQLNDAEYCSCS